MSDIVWRRSDDWVGTTVEDSFIMVSVETGKYIALNKTADAVWQALETPHSESELCDLLRARFDVPAEDCARGVSAALEEMRALQLTAPL